jgi:hypothetical protein
MDFSKLSIIYLYLKSVSRLSPLAAPWAVVGAQAAHTGQGSRPNHTQSRSRGLCAQKS